jgi:hypothetical protein
MTNSIDRDQWLFFFALGRNRTRDPRVPEPKRAPLGYILPKNNIWDTMRRKISRNFVPSSCIRHDNSTKENFIFKFYTVFLNLYVFL